jgi:hypothetical protein
MPKACQDYVTTSWFRHDLFIPFYNHINPSGFNGTPAII